MAGIPSCKVNRTKRLKQEELYVETIGNITDGAVQKYIKEQSE